MSLEDDNSGLWNTLKFLKRNENSPVSNLKKQADSLRAFHNLFKGTDKAERLRLILNEDQPESLVPGSVGEFLYGCDHRNILNSEVPRSTIPSCIRAYNSNHDHNVTIYEIRQGKLTTVALSGRMQNVVNQVERSIRNGSMTLEQAVTAFNNEIGNDKITIYTDNDNPSYWQSLISASGIKKFEIFLYDETNTKYRKTGDYSRQVNLPSVGGDSRDKNKNKNNDENKNKNMEQNHTNIPKSTERNHRSKVSSKSTSTTGVLDMILLMVILLAITYVMYVVWWRRR